MSRGVSVERGLCSRRKSLSREFLSRGSLSRRKSLSGGLIQRRGVSETPSCMVEEEAVRILLGCILVFDTNEFI